MTFPVVAVVTTAPRARFTPVTVSPAMSRQVLAVAKFEGIQGQVAGSAAASVERHCGRAIPAEIERAGSEAVAGQVER